MKTERNRPNSIESHTATAFFDKLPVDLFVHRRDPYGLETFVTEFRPMLANFLAEVLLYDDEIDSVLEDSIEHFRNSKHTRSWHKTVNYRHVIGKILIDTLLNQVAFRRWRREANSDAKLGIDLGASNLDKQLSIAWRKHIVDESWQRLRHKELESGRPYFTILKRRYDKPWMSNGRLLHDSAEVFKAMPTKQAFRVFLFRSEQHLARNIVTTVAETIHLPNSEAVQRELDSLDLAHFWERLATAPAAAEVPVLNPEKSRSR